MEPSAACSWIYGGVLGTVADKIIATLIRQHALSTETKIIGVLRECATCLFGQKGDSTVCD